MWSWKLTWRWQDFEFSCCTSKMGRPTLTFGNIIFVFRFKYKTTLGIITFVVYILCLWVWIPLRGKDPQREGRINEAKVSQNVFLIHIFNGKTKQVTEGCTEDIFVFFVKAFFSVILLDCNLWGLSVKRFSKSFQNLVLKLNHSQFHICRC